MKKYHGIWMASFLLATIFSIGGQGIAYSLSKHFMPIMPVYYLTGVTILGYLLYLQTAFLLFRLLKNKNFTCKYLKPIAVLLFIIALHASGWSFFVTAMWWG
ncbi:hypothetical protein H1Q58_08245 [Planococcus maritimus]|uniref:Uncharacterized protein n=1 Tax=Planococcus maritimus TaxID=192421 RepID=A0A7D7RFM1_PLAMR|nr:hypothetical protein [Planococcus maritimus]QMT15983.1 hypothetical protein H1Q58_08245 [Planococcus maritimus]